MNTIYLKALEIQGFKSFADKTRLTFEKDITAIVGPNGSGKSNISDAILWVMGEQRTKALRGNKMEDITAEDCSLVNRNPAYRDCKWFRGAVNVDLFYGTADEERNLTAWQRPGADTPEVRHLTFRNLSIQTEGGRAIFLCGLPERHLTGIHLENIRAESRQGMAVENTDDLSIRALQLTVAGESEE